MCDTCGCQEADDVRVTVPGAQVGEAAVDHDAHPHQHPHDDGASHTVPVEERILAKNDRLAEGNREWLAARGIVAVNVMGSPGAGKTTLLERTIRELTGHRPVGVVEGDQETLLDAERIRATGCPVVQVNTGAGCHLDAAMVNDALHRLEPAEGSLVFVENVGNLVCPALFDLGESARVVLASVTEGEDKPVKYPHMFRSADVVLLTKTDLLPHLDFDAHRFVELVHTVQPGVEVLSVSATRDIGLDAWCGWLGSLPRESAIASALS